VPEKAKTRSIGNGSARDDYVLRVQAKAKPLRELVQVSAAASVGASVLCIEVSTGHPHPSPATKK